MISKDILIRNAAVVVIVSCGAYLVFGLAAGVAADQPGTAIRHYDPISFGLLWREISKLSFEAVVKWFPVFGGWWLGLALSLAFAFGSSALALAVHPRLLSHLRTPAVALLGLGLALLSVFGLFGLLHFTFTLLNAFVLRGLDGEWALEQWAVFDSIGILYLVAGLLFLRSLYLYRSDRRAVAGLPPQSLEPALR